MALSIKRIGTATSSSIVSLVSEGRSANSIGSPFFTYVEECRYERSLLQNLESEIEVLATEWGKLVESFVHKKLPKDDTKQHPKYPVWVGTPDGSKYKVILKKLVLDAITDIKCPLTKKAFCQLVSGLYEELPEGGVKKIDNPDMKKALSKLIDKAKDGKKFYWQLVSNSCIFNTKYAELIVFMPYFQTLEEIIKYNDNLPESSYKVAFARPGQLPFILKESGYEEINTIRFEVPIADKLFLEKRVRIFDAIMDLSSNDYELFLENAEQVKYKQDEICSLLKLD
jgi:hypothetical protein